MRRRIYGIILIAIFIGFASVKAADNNTFRTYMASDGLSDNTVLCGLRDSYGFMWLGTNNGLNCFDGITNTIYRNMVDEKNSYENNIIISLMENGKDIWFGGSFGLYIYKRDQNTFNRFDESTKYGVVVSSTVQKIMKSRNGLIWICTMGQGIFIYNPTTHELSQCSRYGGFVSDICQGDDGNIYIAMLQGKLVEFSPIGRFLHSYDMPDYINDKNKICIQHQNNEIWLGTDAGLYHLNRITNVIDKVPTPFSFGSINSIVTNSQGRLLLATNHGLYEYEAFSQQFSRVDGKNGIQGLSDQNINSMLIDKDGTLWLLTSIGGVNYLPKPRTLFPFYSLVNADSDNMITVESFYEEKNGDVWIGTSNGLYYYDHTTKTAKPYAGGKFTFHVTSLLKDGNDLWIGTKSTGIRVINLATGQTKAYTYSADKPYTVASNDINCMYRTTKGNIFIATSWGICRFDRATERFMGFALLGSMTEFVDIVEDSNGRLWVASGSRGAYCFDSKKGTWTPYTYDKESSTSISSNSLIDICRDSRGRMWFATKGGGLCRYDETINGFVRIPMEDNTIYFVKEDSEHNLWISSESGIMRIDIDDDDRITHVADNNNLWNGRMLYRSALFSRSGVMFFGSVNGYYHFYPNKLKGGKQKHLVYISSISLPYVSDSKAEIATLGLNRPLYMIKEVELPYRDNSFTLHFSAPRFGLTHGVVYEYMLNGVDNQWAHGSGNVEATYANLSPGTYEFMLREAGNTNDSQIAKLKITVLPPWYRTGFAYMIYFFLLCFVVYIASRRAQQVLQQRYNIRLSEYRAKKDKEMFQSKIKFFVNLVHEIRTPLSLISLPLERMEQQNRDDNDKRYLSIIRKNMNYLLGITNQLLDFQKVEDGAVILNKKNCSVKSILSDVYEQFSGYMDAEGKNILLQLPDNDTITAIDRDRVNKIMMNLMSNALKYTRSRIIIKMDEPDGDNLVKMSVIDDGPGIPDNEKEKIFDTFYQVKNDKVASMLGTGLGLSYARMLARNHNGDLKVEDAEGGGSCFTLILPVTLVNENEEEYKSASNDIRLLPEDDDNQEQDKPVKNFTILLVEDNADLLNMTRDALQNWYHVLKASDGVEALQVISEREVDVIVSDVMMPNMDGIELCSKIKGNINYSHIPLILLTAKTTVEAKVEGMKSGADIYLEKPFAIQQLHMQIENLLRLRQSFYNKMKSINGDIEEITPSEYGLTQQNIQFVDQIQRLLAENMSDESFSIDSLAEQLNMSRSSFYRKLKSLTGMTPVDFMKSQRMKRAAVLLLDGRSISEVAERVGFSSASYFTKCFKSQFGVLPKDYVANKTEEGTVEI